MISTQNTIVNFFTKQKSISLQLDLFSHYPMSNRVYSPNFDVTSEIFTMLMPFNSLAYPLRPNILSLQDAIVIKVNVT